MENIRNLEDAADDAWAYPAVTWIDNRALITYFNYKGGLSLKLKSLPSEWSINERKNKKQSGGDRLLRARCSQSGFRARLAVDGKLQGG